MMLSLFGLRTSSARFENYLIENSEHELRYSRVDRTYLNLSVIKPIASHVCILVARAVRTTRLIHIQLIDRLALT